jgi:hypothetical protein
MDAQVGSAFQVPLNFVCSLLCLLSVVKGDETIGITGDRSSIDQIRSIITIKREEQFKSTSCFAFLVGFIQSSYN